MNEQETVRCKFCYRETKMCGTQMCNRCWEVSTRLPDFVKYKNSRDYIHKVLKEYENEY